MLRSILVVTCNKLDYNWQTTVHLNTTQLLSIVICQDHAVIYQVSWILVIVIQNMSIQYQELNMKWELFFPFPFLLHCTPIPPFPFCHTLLSPWVLWETIHSWEHLCSNIWELRFCCQWSFICEYSSTVREFKQLLEIFYSCLQCCTKIYSHRKLFIPRSLMQRHSYIPKISFNLQVFLKFSNSL